MKNFFDNIKLLIDDLFYETKEPVKNKEILLTYQNLNDYIKILQDYKNNPLNKNKNQISDDDLLNIVKSKR